MLARVRCARSYASLDPHGGVQIEFGVVIRRFNIGSDRRLASVTLRFKRSIKYTTPLRKLKRDETDLRKCEYHFRLHDYSLLRKCEYHFTLHDYNLLNNK